MAIGLVWGLHHWTAGFEVWTFEGRRHVQLQTGVLRARPIAMRGIDGRIPPLWHDANPVPAAYLVDFIYTRCPSVCRVLGNGYQQMQRQLVAQHGVDPAVEAVHLVSISFDVGHDDPAQLAQFANGLRADPRWWTFAVPATSADATTLLRSLGVVVIADGQGGFVHNGSVHLLDGQGRLRGLFEFDQWPQALAAARQLAAERREASQ